MNKKNILITGVTGAIGSELLRQLYNKKEGYFITVLVRKSWKNKKFLKRFQGLNVVFGDLRNYNEIVTACSGQDYAIHLAAVIPPRAEYSPAEAEKVNVGGTKNLVRALEQHSPNVFLI